MKKYNVLVDVCRDRNVRYSWSISMEANTPQEIAKAIRKMSGKKYVDELVSKVNKEYVRPSKKDFRREL